MGTVDAVIVGSSPPWVDAVVSIAPVELLDTRELALVAVHPDGCVTAWSPQDPSVILMRKRPMQVTCVTSAHENAQHSSLAWFGRSTGVQCYRARRREGRYVHLQSLYNLRVDGATEILELQTDGILLVAVVERNSPEVFFWSAIDGVANADNIAEKAERCAASCLFGSSTTFSDKALGNVSSLLMVGDTVWIGCTSGAIVLIDTKENQGNNSSLRVLLTAGSCAVTALTLLAHPLRGSFVVSGLVNGDIVLWSVRGGVHFGQYFEHAGAICAMTYVPWGLGLCTVSTMREVFFWGWQEASDILRVVERGVLDDDIGSSTLRCLCAVRDTEILACGGERSHILHWKTQCEADATEGVFSTSSPILGEDLQLMIEELRELRDERRQWQELCASSEPERRNVKHNPFDSQLDVDVMGHMMKKVEEEHDLDLQKKDFENSHQILLLRAQLEAVQEERNQLLEKMHTLEEDGKKAREVHQAEVAFLRKEKWTVEECAAVLKAKLSEQKELTGAQCAVREEKGVNTDDGEWRPQTPPRVVSHLEKGTQVSSHSLYSRIEETRGEKEMSSEAMCMSLSRDSLQRCDNPSIVLLPLLDAFTERATPQSLKADYSSLNHENILCPPNGIPSVSSQRSDKTLVSSCVVDALQLQLSLMEVLLRNLRAASASVDPLLVQSTNILSDVYLIVRDVLGNDMSSSFIHGALEDRPFSSEREVICKLFFTLCSRYRAALLQSSN